MSIQSIPNISTRHIFRLPPWLLLTIVLLVGMLPIATASYAKPPPPPPPPPARPAPAQPAPPTSAPAPAPVATPTTQPEAAPGAITTLPAIVVGVMPNGRAYLIDSSTGEPFEVRGVNYNRPSNADPTVCPEFQFGMDGRCPWDMTTIRADLQQLRAHGVNTIRIFLNYYTFGGARLTMPDYPLNTVLQRLDMLLAAAHDEGIYVIPVLLAKYPQDQFAPEGYATALMFHVYPVVGHLAGRPGILAWDLFNEPDLGGPVDGHCWDWGNEAHPYCFPLANERLHFLSMLVQQVRILDRGRPLTVSVGIAKNYWHPIDADLRLADLVDFYAFHYYDNEPKESGRYRYHWYYGDGFPYDLKRAIDEFWALGLQKPVLITELGFPSGEGHLRTTEELYHNIDEAMEIGRHDAASGMILWLFREQPIELAGGIFR